MVTDPTAERCVLYLVSCLSLIVTINDKHSLAYIYDEILKIRDHYGCNHSELHLACEELAGYVARRMDQVQYQTGDSS